MISLSAKDDKPLSEIYPKFKTPANDKILLKLYKHFNKLYFKNELPELTEVGFRAGVKKRHGQASIRYTLNKVSNKYEAEYRIEISNFNANSRRLITEIMLHEMIHIWQYWKYNTPSSGGRAEKYLDRSRNKNTNGHGYYFQREMNRLNEFGFNIVAKGDESTYTSMSDWVYGIAMHKKDQSGLIVSCTEDPRTDTELWYDGMIAHMGQNYVAYEVFRTRSSRVINAKRVSAPAKLGSSPRIFYKKEYLEEILEDKDTEILVSKEIKQDAAIPSNLAATLRHKSVLPFKEDPFRVFLQEVLEYTEHSRIINTRNIENGDSPMAGVPQSLIQAIWKSWNTVEYTEVKLGYYFRAIMKDSAVALDVNQKIIDNSEKMWETYKERSSKAEMGKFLIKGLTTSIHSKNKSTLSRSDAKDIAEMITEDLGYEV